MFVNLLECGDDDGEHDIRLNTDNLSKILCQSEIENKPLAIVGIAGPFRTGKSFLLSFVLRYLKSKKDSQSNSKDWIGDDDKCADDGVSWSSGIKAHTKGIDMWNEIFYIPINNEDKLAVLFLDTQGLFDHTMSKEENTKLFTFTVLLCSNLILNIKDLINERELESLEFFTEYAKSIDAESENQSPFQRLMFLLRDWQHCTDHAYGPAGGRDYLSDVLQSSKSEENTSVRKNLRSAFQTLDCFLLPYPGECIKKAEFKGRNGDLKPEFLEKVKELVSAIFHPDNLAAKSYDGKMLTGRSLWTLLKTCSNSFVNGELPKVNNMTTAFAEMRNTKAMEDSLAVFKKEFENRQGECDENLDVFYKEANQLALKHFETEARFGPEDMRSRHRQQLIVDIQEIYKSYRQFDDLRKIVTHNNSCEKVHEMWSQYMKSMKEGMREVYQTADALRRMHKNYSDTALKSYQIVTSKNVAFNEEHFKQLDEDLAHSFEKFEKVNHERHYLEQTQQEESPLNYEGYLYLHQASQKYREELEKFAAVYIEEEVFEEQMIKMKTQYRDIFVKNWSSEANIDMFLEEFIETLEEEYDDALKMNKRNKNVFQKRLEESALRVKVDYRKVMFGLIENSYVDPKTLNEEHENILKKLLENLESELNVGFADEIKNQVMTEVRQAFDRMYIYVKNKNKLQKDAKPLLDDGKKSIIMRSLSGGLGAAFIAMKYNSSNTKGNLLIKAVTAPNIVLAALPATPVLAGAAAGLIGAYGVYRYYNKKTSN